MGRSPCCSKQGLNRGAWTKEEDMILSTYIQTHGDGEWKILPQKAGGAFKAQNGLIQKKPIVTRVWEPTPNEIKVEKEEVGEAAQEAMP